MSTTVAAFLATLITTGMTSAVSHQFTLVGGSAAAIAFAFCALVSPNVRMYPIFLVGSLVLCVISLVSSESNTSEFTSTIHVLSSYAALAALAFSSPDMSKFCQQLIMGNNILLTVWVLYQAQHVDGLSAWQISNPSGAGNLMAAQINMTLPLILARIHEKKGLERLVYCLLLCMNCTAVFFVMSRNGTGAMMIVLTLYALFNHKKLAFMVISMVPVAIIFLDQLLRLPFIHNLLVKMRIIGFVAQAPRSVIWQISWDHVLANPMLGVGPGEPRRILAVLDINHAHNNFMQVAFETGLPSAVIFVAMAALLISMPATMLFRKREHFVHTLPILAYMIFSWTGGPLTFPGATLLLAACVNEARVAMARQVAYERRWGQVPSSSYAPQGGSMEVAQAM